MLLLKLLLVPSLIAVVTLVGRRWGASVAGWLAGFPIVAGPILFWIAQEQGAGFAATAAAGALSATCANVAFALAYAWTALRHPWWVCLAAGYAVFAVATLGFQGLGLANGLMLAGTFVAITVGVRCFPRGLDPRPQALPPRLELPVRMAAAALLVGAVTYFADTMGPAVSGVFAAPPLLASVLAAFSHPVAGAGFAIQLLRGMILGFYALASFCWGLTFWLPRLETGAAFTVSLAGAIAVAGLARALQRRQPV